MFSPHHDAALPTNTPRDCSGGRVGGAAAGDCRAHSPWTAPRVRKKNKSCCSTLREVTEELLEEPVRRKGTLSPAARELQPFFAEESDSSRESSPARGPLTAGSSGRFLPFGLPAICSNSDAFAVSPCASSGRAPVFGNDARGSSPASSIEQGPAVEDVYIEEDHELPSACSPRSPVVGGRAAPAGLRVFVPADDGDEHLMDVHDSVASLPSPSSHGFGSFKDSKAVPFALSGPRLSSPWDCREAQAPIFAVPQSTDEYNQLLKQAVREGDGDAVEHTFREMADSAVPPDVDTLNMLLRCMCRVSADPEEAEELVAEYCQDGGIQPNASTVCYLSALWTQREQLST